MKKTTALLLALLLALTASAAFADGQSSFQALTGLNKIISKVQFRGVTIEEIYYSETLEDDVTEFTTTDRDQIALIWYALCDLGVGGRSYDEMTGMESQIILYLSDGTSHGVWFQGLNVVVNGSDQYTLQNDAFFRTVMAQLAYDLNEEQNADGGVVMPEDDGRIGNPAVRPGRRTDPTPTPTPVPVYPTPVPANAGWIPVSNTAATQEVTVLLRRALGTLTGVDYKPIAYLGYRAYNGMSHALLCQETVVVPDAVPTYVIVYIHQDLYGNTQIEHIENLELGGYSNP